MVTSSTFDAKFGCQAFFKAECFQRTGSFKYRGATNSILQLSPEQKEKGVLTFSSGNHAQALALAGAVHGVKVVVVMPSDAPAIKKAATEGYGAEVILYDRAEAKREELGRMLSEERGLSIIPPYDHAHIICGAGTAAKELLEDHPDLDMLLVCCGGGGLLGGSSLAAKALQPGIWVAGVEPDAGNDGCLSFASGAILTIENPVTIADGARTPYVGQLNFALMKQKVDAMTSVSDRTLLECTLFAWTRMKVMVEPTGALAMAAIWEGKVDAAGKKVGILISGGNCDPAAVVAAADEVLAR